MIDFRFAHLRIEKITESPSFGDVDAGRPARSRIYADIYDLKGQPIHIEMDCVTIGVVHKSGRMWFTLPSGAGRPATHWYSRYGVYDTPKTINMDGSAKMQYYEPTVWRDF